MPKRKADQMVVGDEEKKKDVASDENERSETSFDDLPDDILIKLFTSLDLPSRLTLRVNKRLVKIQRSIMMKIELLEIEITRDQYVLTLDTSDVCYRREFDDFTLLENTFRGLVNTSVERLSIKSDLVPSEKVASVINLLSKFDADKLRIVRKEFGGRLRIPQVTLSTLLTLAQNVGDIDIGIIFNAVSAQDLCTLRKSMLEGSCKLKSFYVVSNEEITENFVEECFGVTVEFEINENDRRTIIVRSANESVELFSDVVLYRYLAHFEDGFLTEVRQGAFCPFISFKKDGPKPDEKDKVKMNHLYHESSDDE